jgi:hypothetical protein
MENKQDLENRISIELKMVGNEIEPSSELYSRIFSDITLNKGGVFSMLKKRLLNMSAKRLVPTALALTLLVGGVSFSVSPSLRAFAEDTINQIKTIFVVEGTKDNYSVVEKPTDEVHLLYGKSKPSTLSNDELSQKLGLQVNIPEALNAEYKLKLKNETITLNNANSEITDELDKETFKAIDDKTAFSNLSQYQPALGASAIYSNGTTDLYLSIGPSSGTQEKRAVDSSSSTVDINGIKAYWIEVPVPERPLKTENGVTLPNLSQKPEEIKVLNVLDWFVGGTYYSFSGLAEQNLTKEQFVELAKSIVK